MSYDVRLVMDTGRGRTVEAFWINYTANTAWIWREAGCDLQQFNGRSASLLADCLLPVIDQLSVSADHIREDPRLKLHEGWGDFEGTLGFLKAIAAACHQHPHCTVEVDS